MTNRTKGGFYAVRKGRIPGIYSTWDDCETQIKGFPAAKFKRFTTMEEAETFICGSLSSDTLGSAQASSSTSSDTKGKKRQFGPEVLDTTGWDIVYSDGACKGNGKVGSMAGVGVWWGPNDSRNIAERCPGDQTNNRAELIAILRVLETTPSTKKPLLIRTDSQYSIQCFKFWIPSWEKNEWLTLAREPVKNAGVIRCISTHLAIRAKSGQKVVLEYVKGHSGDVGNDGADAMANRGALLPNTPEREWKSIEEQLQQNLSQLATGGEVAELTVLAPVDLADTESMEAPTKVPKLLGDRATISSSKLAAAKHTAHTDHPPLRSPAKSSSKSNHAPLSTSRHAPTATTNLVDRAPQSPVVKHRQDNPCASLQKPTSSTYSHICGTKSPSKVTCADLPVVPVPLEDVKLEDYADCLLDDSELAKEIF